MQMPVSARVRLCNGSGHQVGDKVIQPADWGTGPFSRCLKGAFFFKTFTFDEFATSQEISRLFSSVGEQTGNYWEILRTASINTLPERLPLYKSGAKPLTVALGSCLLAGPGWGVAWETAYRGLYENPQASARQPGPHLSDRRSGLSRRRVRRPLLGGDGGSSPHCPGLRAALAGSRRCPDAWGQTTCLPDDHEWYNGYPEAPDSKNPYLWPLQDKSLRKAWETCGASGH